MGYLAKNNNWLLEQNLVSYRTILISKKEEK
jgi:hypothetical protein